MTQTNLLKKAVLFSGVAIIAFAATAHAGFEWKGPLGAPAPAAEAAPVDTQPNDDLTPVTSWENPADAAPAPMAAAPVEAMPAPVAAAPANDVVAAPVASEPASDVLTGFGSDVPLVIALQQVVPAGYQYSFAAGVNPGVSVSWQGGKSWQGVLADMLAAQGLGYRIQNSAVIVGNYASPEQPAAPAAPEASDASLGMTAVPSDNAPVAIASPAPVQSAPVQSTVVSEKPVTIHREKRSSLLERLGWTQGTKEETRNVAVPSDTAGGEMPAVEPAPAAAPADTSMSSDPVPAPVTESSASNEPQQLAAATPPVRSAADAAMSSSATEVGATTAAAAPAPAMNGNWKGAKGQTLRDVLKTWSDQAGVELYWSIDYDYRLSDDVATAGNYEQAVGGLLDKFASVRPQPYGQLHQSASGPRVLVVKSYDLTR
jgi:hypothetical protein